MWKESSMNWDGDCQKINSIIPSLVIFAHLTMLCKQMVDADENIMNTSFNSDVNQFKSVKEELFHRTLNKF